MAQTLNFWFLQFQVLSHAGSPGGILYVFEERTALAPYLLPNHNCRGRGRDAGRVEPPVRQSTQEQVQFKSQRCSGPTGPATVLGCFVPVRVPMWPVSTF